jgi:prepilin-type N-terminal cleavage/methylation domain-containing protein
MNIAVRRNPVARAFTLIELIAVIVVLAILSGIAIPKYFDYAASAKASSTKGTLGGVRSAIANFYANSAVNGTAAYPTLVQVQTTGTVMQEAIPANPYNSSSTIAAATWAATPPVTGANGWNYDAASGRFWANSTTSGVNEHLW